MVSPVKPFTEFHPSFKPLTHTTPFTFTGYAFLEMYEELVQYLTNTLSVELNENLDLIYAQTQVAVNGLAADITTTKTQWQALFEQFMLDIIEELEGLNDASMANLVKAPESLTRIELEKLYATKAVVTDAIAALNVSISEVRSTTVRIDKNVLNVLDHGVTGLGVVDETAKIQSLVNIANGKDILFPPGSYLVRGVVELPNDTTLIGNKALLFKDGVNQSSYAFFCTRSNGSRGYGSGGSNISARGFHFKGDFSKNVGVCAFALHHTDGFTATENIFEEMLDTGHIIDLAGCQNINIYNNQFIGATDINSRAEAIQIDISAVGALSVLDAAGSHDGLMTRDVRIRDNFFLPLVKGATFYPAPVPLGSHSQWEGKYSRNISFIDNVVDSPRMHVSSWPTGIIHFSMTKNLKIIGNDFIGRGSADARIVSVVKAETGVPAGMDPNVPQVNVAFTDAIFSEGIDISGNTFTGFLGVGVASDLIFVDGVNSVNILGNIADKCASFIDARSASSCNVSNNIYRNAPSAIGASVMSFNRVRGFTATGNQIYALGVVAPTALVAISNNSYWGFFTLNVVQGMGEAGIAQVAGSTIFVGNNNTTQPAG